MDQATVIQLVAGCLTVVLLFVLIMRRRNRKA